MNRIERDRDPRLHRQHVGLEPGRQIAAEHRDQRAEHARISTHSSIEPSWFPHTPVIL